MDDKSLIGQEIHSWKIPEREHYEHSVKWKITAGLVALALIALAVLTSNFLFALIILIAAFIVVFNEGEQPDLVKFTIGTEGVMLGDKFYDYDDFKSFSVLYKPNQDLKALYLDCRSSWRRDLIIPLLDNNPLPIRENLLKYLKEDLERTDEPFIETISRFLKL
ncbi:MAG TPA: hypothetical protein PKN62_00665 [bacterium]|nr:hypothetical protein [bacterium]